MEAITENRGAAIALAEGSLPSMKERKRSRSARPESRGTRDHFQQQEGRLYAVIQTGPDGARIVDNAYRTRAEARCAWPSAS